MAGEVTGRRPGGQVGEHIVGRVGGLRPELLVQVRQERAAGWPGSPSGTVGVLGRRMPKRNRPRRRDVVDAFA
ncbi:hypothetical protein GCM10009680_69480 [Streptomyces yatensis]|uniref:Uncharacterized protein n=1 Tax=Streptomyces yatensis TaxID=155177 RepID=A0ABN2J549_9ACTN